MTDPNKSLLLDINFRTALLESLDWDESQFDSLLLYLKENMALNLQTPKDLLDSIHDLYGENTYILVKKMFKEVYIENGLYKKPEGDYEH